MGYRARHGFSILEILQLINQFSVPDQEEKTASLDVTFKVAVSFLVLFYY